MKRTIHIMLVVLAMLVSMSATAEHLELGLAVTPSWMHDDDFTAITERSAEARVGLDIRSEVADLGGFKLVPLIGYRFSNAEGNVYSFLDTSFNLHDFYLGLRVRKGLLSWLGLFLEAKGGVLYASMEASLYGDYSGISGARDRYTDKMVTWSAGGLLGVETYFSRAWLRSRGVKRFCFGGEVAMGYIRRGDLSVDPTLGGGGGGNAIDAETLGTWGTINPSGWELQLAASFFFF